MTQSCQLHVPALIELVPIQIPAGNYRGYRRSAPFKPLRGATSVEHIFLRLDVENIRVTDLVKWGLVILME